MKSTPKPPSAARSGTFVADDLTQLLGRPIAYHRIFAHLGGDANAAVFLSQALHWTPRASHKNKKAPADEGWFFKSQADFWEETGLTRYNQETARRKWRKLGVLEERRAGQSGHIFYRINLERLAQLLRALIDGEHSQFQMLESNSSNSYEITPGTDRKQRNIKGAKTTTKITSKTTATSDVDVFSDSALVDQLIAAGAAPTKAKTGVETNAAEMQSRLTYLKTFTPDNPGAWLTAKPAEHFTPPKAALEATAAADRDEAAAVAAAARRAASTAAAAERATSAQENANLDTLFEKLPTAQQNKIRRAAEEQIAPLKAMKLPTAPALAAAIRDQMRAKIRTEEK